MPAVQVVRTYLEMTSPAGLQPSREHPDAAFAERASCTVEHYRELYRQVGEAWNWRDRLVWSDAQVAQHLALPTVRIWELSVRGDTAGFFELQQHEDMAVEIVYFGLLADYFGRGLGGAMLTRAVREAWALGAERVWLHTCSLDSPSALPNYRARGFREFRHETYTAELPDE